MKETFEKLGWEEIEDSIWKKEIADLLFIARYNTSNTSITIFAIGDSEICTWDTCCLAMPTYSGKLADSLEIMLQSCEIEEKDKYIRWKATLRRSNYIQNLNHNKFDLDIKLVESHSIELSSQSKGKLIHSLRLQGFGPMSIAVLLEKVEISQPKVEIIVYDFAKSLFKDCGNAHIISAILLMSDLPADNETYRKQVYDWFTNNIDCTGKLNVNTKLVSGRTSVNLDWKSVVSAVCNNKGTFYEKAAYIVQLGKYKFNDQRLYTHNIKIVEEFLINLKKAMN